MQTLGLNLKNLHFAHGSQKILIDISALFPVGTLVGVIGPNGSGKSHLLRQVAGIINGSGTIHFNNVDLTTIATNERARFVSWLDQSPSFEFDYSVADAVVMGRFSYHRGLPTAEDLEKVLKELAFWNLSQKVREPLSHLSQGELQRVYLARTFVGEAPLILLDEPDNNLDMKSKLLLFARLKDLVAKGKTVLCVLHNIDDVLAHTSHVIALKNGIVALQGEVEKTLTEAALMKLFDVGASVESGDGKRPPKVHFYL